MHPSSLTLLLHVKAQSVNQLSTDIVDDHICSREDLARRLSHARKSLNSSPHINPKSRSSPHVPPSPRIPVPNGSRAQPPPILEKSTKSSDAKASTSITMHVEEKGREGDAPPFSQSHLASPLPTRPPISQSSLISSTGLALSPRELEGESGPEREDVIHTPTPPPASAMISEQEPSAPSPIATQIVTAPSHISSQMDTTAAVDPSQLRVVRECVGALHTSQSTGAHLDANAFGHTTAASQDNHDQDNLNHSSHSAPMLPSQTEERQSSTVSSPLMAMPSPVMAADGARRSSTSYVPNTMLSSCTQVIDHYTTPIPSASSSFLSSSFLPSPLLLYTQASSEHNLGSIEIHDVKGSFLSHSASNMATPTSPISTTRVRKQSSPRLVMQPSKQPTREKLYHLLIVDDSAMSRKMLIKVPHQRTTPDHKPLIIHPLNSTLPFS